MSDKQQLTTAQEKEKVLQILIDQENALQKNQRIADLSEDDFVQYLNLATKKDLVSQASEFTLQELADRDKQQMEEEENLHQGDGGVATAAVIGGVAGGPKGAVALGSAAVAGPAIATVAVGAPVAGGFWLWGKGKEIVRTFKTSYQHDHGANRLGKALWRSVKYPFFKIPLINKMRQDFNFKATPEDRREFKHELMKRRVKNSKDEAIRCAKLIGRGALICGALGGLFGGVAAFETGNFEPLLCITGLSAAIGSAMGACVYPITSLIRMTDKLESKARRGRRLIEQALNYPPVEQSQQIENEKTTAPDELRKVKAQFLSDEALSHMAEKRADKDDGEPNVFNRLHRRSSRQSQKDDLNVAMVSSQSKDSYHS